MVVTLYDPKSGTPVRYSDTDIAKAREDLLSGKVTTRKAQSFNLIDPETKKVGSVSGEMLPQYLNQGFGLESEKAQKTRKYVEENEGLIGTAKVAGGKFASEAAFGIPELIYEKTASPQDLEEWNALKEEHSVASVVGSLGGMGASLYVGGPVFKGAAKLGTMAETAVRGAPKVAEGLQAATQAATKAPGLFRTMGAKAIGSMAEGAAISAPRAVTEAVLGDPMHGGEDLLVGAGLGLGLAGLVGGARYASKKAVQGLDYATSGLINKTPNAAARALMAGNEEEGMRVLKDLKYIDKKQGMESVDALLRDHDLVIQPSEKYSDYLARIQKKQFDIQTDLEKTFRTIARTEEPALVTNRKSPLANPHEFFQSVKNAAKEVKTPKDISKQLEDVVYAMEAQRTIGAAEKRTAADYDSIISDLKNNAPGARQRVELTPAKIKELNTIPVEDWIDQLTNEKQVRIKEWIEQQAKSGGKGWMKKNPPWYDQLESEIAKAKAIAKEKGGSFRVQMDVRAGYPHITNDELIQILAKEKAMADETIQGMRKTNSIHWDNGNSTPILERNIKHVNLPGTGTKIGTPELLDMKKMVEDKMSILSKGEGGEVTSDMNKGLAAIRSKIDEALKNNIETIYNADPKILKLNNDLNMLKGISQVVDSSATKEALKDMTGSNILSKIMESKIGGIHGVGLQSVVKGVLFGGAVMGHPVAAAAGFAANYGLQKFERFLVDQGSRIAANTDRPGLVTALLARAEANKHFQGFEKGTKVLMETGKKLALAESNKLTNTQGFEAFLGHKVKSPEEGARLVRDQFNAIKQNPDEFDKILEETANHIANGAPGVAAEYRRQIQNQIAVLTKAMPLNPATPTPFSGGTKVDKTSKKDAKKFNDWLTIANDPWSIQTALATNTVTAEHVTALQALYPNTYSKMMLHLAQTGMETESKLATRYRGTVSMFMQQPLSNAYGDVQSYQNTYGPKPQAPATSMGGGSGKSIKFKSLPGAQMLPYGAQSTGAKNPKR